MVFHKKRWGTDPFVGKIVKTNSQVAELAIALHIYGEYCFDTINQVKGTIQVRVLS